MSFEQEEICAHLQACEEALLDPHVRRDGALLAEDFLEFGSSGRVWTREEIIGLLATGDYNAPAIEDFKCDLIGEDVALVTYRTVREDAHSGPEPAALRSSLWTKESGAWRMRFHQGTRVP